MRDALVPRGRLFLDVYNREFFELHQGSRTFEVAGVPVREVTRVEGHRLNVVLRYTDTDETDVFDWRLYHPGELVAQVTALRFRHVVGCTGFDESRRITSESPRMQLVFEREAEK